MIFFENKTVDIQDISTWQAWFYVLVLAALIFLMSSLMYVFILDEIIVEQSQWESKRSHKQRQLNRSISILKSHVDIEQVEQKLTHNLKNNYVFDSSKLSIMRDIEELLHKAQLKIINLNWKKKTFSWYDVSSITLQVGGKFHEVSLFISRLSLYLPWLELKEVA